MERSLAKCEGFDVGVEDHGILIMYGTFRYDEGGCQGFAYAIDTAFIYRFLDVFNVEKLQDVNGKSCWVTHDMSSITIVEPLHKKEGIPFNILEWREFVKSYNLPSPHELRTGKIMTSERLAMFRKRLEAEQRIDSYENQELLDAIDALHTALRAAPMPYRESTLDSDDWDATYDKWWHSHASEDALAGKKIHVV